MFKFSHFALLSVVSLSAHAGSTHRVDHYAPIGVMGAHLHEKGDFMLSYRYSQMNMQGSQDGTNDIATGDNPFPVVPLEMTMKMHMLGGMYAPSDDWTIMAMLPYIELEMDHIVQANGRRFTTRAEGIGDIKLASLHNLYKKNDQQVIMKFDLSLPTGSIDERDDTPAQSDSQLPYPMQLGSGTYDLMPAITYTQRLNGGSWGSQVSATLRTGGSNDRNYRLGNEIQATAWYTHLLTQNSSASLRINYLNRGNVRGRDNELNPNIVQTAVTSNQGRERIDLSTEFSHSLQQGTRLSIELSAPIYQDLDGPQLETDLQFTLGIQHSF